MVFKPLHLNHLQQVRCCCWCKVKNSESKSQQKYHISISNNVVVAGVKLKILKANHNIDLGNERNSDVVVAGVKL